MTTRDAAGEVPQSDAGLPASIPSMPRARSDEIFRGRPYLLANTGVRHSIGWQEHTTAGLGFVVARRSRLDTVKVTERFPMTEQGWASAWQALSARDADAASVIAAKLAERDARRRATAGAEALDHESLSTIRQVTLSGGSGAVPLARGSAYDLRFLDDRILVCQAGSTQTRMEVPYRTVETVEIGGPGEVGKTTGELIALVLAIGLAGALVGLVVLGLLGFLIGAMLFGLVGALVGAASTRIETTVLIRTDKAELSFLHTEKLPEVLRVHLSGALRAIDIARAAPPSDHGQRAEPAEPTGPPSGSISDELGKLASLLERGFITRQEFDQLKARLIAKS